VDMPVKYRSTRGGAEGWKFENVVLGGLAPDGGLFIPEEVCLFGGKFRKAQVEARCSGALGLWSSR